MKISTEHIARVTASLGPGDEALKIPAVYSRNFYLIATRIVAEFADISGEFLGAEVTGQRYRILKAGDKPVGNGNGGRPQDPSVWTFGPRIPEVMHPVILEMRANRWAKS